MTNGVFWPWKESMHNDLIQIHWARWFACFLTVTAIAFCWNNDKPGRKMRGFFWFAIACWALGIATGALQIL